MPQGNPKEGRQSVGNVAREVFLFYLADAQRRGLKSYGMPLKTFNGRDPIQDELEELVDAWQYATQTQLEVTIIRALAEDLVSAIEITAECPRVIKDRAMWLKDALLSTKVGVNYAGD